MREYHDLGPLPREFANRRYGPLDPGRVADLPVVHRDVEVGTQQDRLPARVEIVDRLELWHGLSSLTPYTPVAFTPCGRPHRAPARRLPPSAGRRRPCAGCWRGRTGARPIGRAHGGTP